MIGAVYDLVDLEAVYQGADWYKEFQLLDPGTGLPYDLTGCTLASQARKRPEDPHPSITFTCTIPDPTGGLIRLALTNVQASAIPRGTYHYDAEITDPDNKVHKVILPESVVQVFGECTR